MRSAWLTAAIACAGAVVGAGVALLVSAFLRDDVRPAVVDLELPPSVDTSRESERDARLRALEQRVTELQTAQTRIVPRSDDAQADVSAPDAEESRRRHLEAHDRSLRAHAREPLDRSWAASTSSTLRADLDVARERLAAEILEVTCRSRSCIARLEWPTYPEARAHFAELLHGRYRVPCTREILLPEPTDPERRYQATALFDCSPR